MNNACDMHKFACPPDAMVKPGQMFWLLQYCDISLCGHGALVSLAVVAWHLNQGTAAQGVPHLFVRYIAGQVAYRKNGHEGGVISPSVERDLEVAGVLSALSDPSPDIGFLRLQTMQIEARLPSHSTLEVSRVP